MTQSQVQAQILAETIALAQKNQSIFSTDDLQEVFGVGVKHFYFEFWHSVVPKEYLYKLSNGIQLDNNELLVMNCFRGNSKEELGLDIKNPNDRRTIVKVFDGILRYLKSGNAAIGKWNLQ